VDCPFKLFRTAVWQRVDMHPRAASLSFNTELLVRARRLGFQVAEVPVSHRRPKRGLPARAASPTEIGRALVELGHLLRDGVSAPAPEPRRLAPLASSRFAPSLRAAAGEPRSSPEPRYQTPDS